jgi:hypothetical protein
MRWELSITTGYKWSDTTPRGICPWNWCVLVGDMYCSKQACDYN